MASIRRTSSLLARTGSSSNGEACQGPSPFSKSTVDAHYPSSAGLLSSVFRLMDPQALVVGVFSPRAASRLGERSKPKWQTWRRPLFHCLVFFIVGIIVGITTFFSMNPWMSIASKQQAFSFEVSAVANLQRHEDSTGNATRIVETGRFNNAAMEPQVKEHGSIDGTLSNISTGSLISNDTGLVINQSIPQDAVLVSRKLLIVVTPTNDRLFQPYYLSRLACILKLVQPPVLWLVVEMTAQSEQTADILRRTGVVYRHLVCKKNLTDIIDKRVHQRNVALSHIETHKLDGIVHFADDENIYSVDLFEWMRQIRRFGTWTVAKFIKSNSKILLEGPVCNGTQVVGWNVSDLRRSISRRFHADMAGFAFNSTIIWDPKRWRRPIPDTIGQLDTGDGFKVRVVLLLNNLEASRFIEQVVEDECQMEYLLEDLPQVMVWQLHLGSSKFFYLPKWFIASNLDAISQLA